MNIKLASLFLSILVLYSQNSHAWSILPWKWNILRASQIAATRNIPSNSKSWLSRIKSWFWESKEDRHNRFKSEASSSLRELFTGANLPKGSPHLTKQSLEKLHSQMGKLGVELKNQQREYEEQKEKKERQQKEKSEKKIHEELEKLVLLRNAEEEKRQRQNLEQALGHAKESEQELQQQNNDLRNVLERQRDEIAVQRKIIDVTSKRELELKKRISEEQERNNRLTKIASGATANVEDAFPKPESSCQNSIIYTESNLEHDLPKIMGEDQVELEPKGKEKIVESSNSLKDSFYRIPEEREPFSEHDNEVQAVERGNPIVEKFGTDRDYEKYSECFVPLEIKHDNEWVLKNWKHVPKGSLKNVFNEIAYNADYKIKCGIRGAYSYVPEGYDRSKKPLVKLVIHGTGFNETSGAGSRSYFDTNHETFQDILLSAQSYADTEKVPVMVLSYAWNGANHNLERIAAAKRAAPIINNRYIQNGYEIMIYAHSHGGNVAAILSQEIPLKLSDGSQPLKLLMFMGTPHRDEYTPANFEKLLAFWSKGDPVQVAGAQRGWKCIIDWWNNWWREDASPRKFPFDPEHPEQRVTNICVTLSGKAIGHSDFVKPISKCMPQIQKQLKQYEYHTDLNLDIVNGEPRITIRHPIEETMFYKKYLLPKILCSENQDTQTRLDTIAYIEMEKLRNYTMEKPSAELARNRDNSERVLAMIASLSHIHHQENKDARRINLAAFRHYNEPLIEKNPLLQLQVDAIKAHTYELALTN